MKQNKSFAQDLDFFYIQWKWFFITMVSALAFHSIDSKCLLFINKSSWAWWIMDSRTLHYVMLVGATGRVCMEAFVQEWSVSQKQFTFLIYWILLLRKTYCTMVYIVTQSHISQLLFNFWIIFLNKSNHKFIQVKELDLACLCSLQFFPLQVMLSHSFSKYYEESFPQWTILCNKNSETDSYFWNTLQINILFCLVPQEFLLTLKLFMWSR